jgi:archaemetzincin
MTVLNHRITEAQRPVVLCDSVPLWLIPLGPVEERILEALPHRRRAAGFDLDFAYDAARRQHNSTLLLERLPANSLAVTGVDLFIPILEYVFGEAELGGGRAVISTYRLRQEIYGLPPDPALLIERAVKEAKHEWGHALGLRHCPRYHCAMHATHSVERIDLKTNGYCRACARLMEGRV